MLKKEKIYTNEEDAVLPGAAQQRATGRSERRRWALTVISAAENSRGHCPQIQNGEQSIFTNKLGG